MYSKLCIVLIFIAYLFLMVLRCRKISNDRKELPKDQSFLREDLMLIAELIIASVLFVYLLYK